MEGVWNDVHIYQRPCGVSGHPTLSYQDIAFGGGSLGVLHDCHLRAASRLPA